MKNSYKLVLDTKEVIGRFDPKYAQAQKWIDNEVLKDSSPYVPMRTGDLMRSGIAGTKLGSGKVNYVMPYAKAMYYGLKFRFSKDKHPQACAQWFEVSKAVHLNDWIKGVNRWIGKG